MIEKLVPSPPWVELMQSCLDTYDIDKRIVNLQRINRLLPKENILHLPSYITNDYIDKILYLLEERLNLAAHEGLNENL